MYVNTHPLTSSLYIIERDEDVHRFGNIKTSCATMINACKSCESILKLVIRALPANWHYTTSKE